MPDMAEHIALDVLRDFVNEVNKVYAPGATLWVISDGHVFSDCSKYTRRATAISWANKTVVGADDAMIDTFDAKMVELYESKYKEAGPVPAIRFKGLKDIFMKSPVSLAGFKERWLAWEVPHPVNTERTHEAELCRKLMLGVGEADRAYIRQCIVEQEPHALQLYRGQTRFMLEDLAEVPSVKSLSNKQKKKTAADVAQEMMSRNQAYSNLVELLLPNYVRLSIHAHPNKGPKFAVRLLPKTMVRPIENLANRHEPVAAYEFQIPTPWHNSIIKVEGDELLYLARAEVAKAAVAGTDFEGSWVDGPSGSYFHLTRTAAVEVAEKAPLTRRPTMAAMSRGVGAFLRLRKKEAAPMEPVAERTTPTPALSMISEKSPLRISTQLAGADESNADKLSPMVGIKPLEKNRRSMSWFSSKSPNTRSPMNLWSRPVVSAV
jgi:pyoverdine/dityrosine biosynthesis protein Dit1